MSDIEKAIEAIRALDTGDSPDFHAGAFWAKAEAIRILREFLPKSKPRSYPHLKRYMAMIRGFFDHWPDAHRFRPKSEDHLRYWLEVEAGHCEVCKTIRCQSVDPDHLYVLLKAVLATSEDTKLFVELDGDLVIVKRALSISYSALGHMDACKLFEDVEKVAEAESGMKVGEVLKAMEAA